MDAFLGGAAPDNRLLVEAAFYRFRAGIAWRDLPEHFGKGKLVHQRFGRWARWGVWERVFNSLGVDVDNEYGMTGATAARAPA